MAERPEDLNLPNAVVTRIIKDALPSGVNIGKDARVAISKAASVFVLYATSCANNSALSAKRKTINVNDVFAAVEDMEFDTFLTPLKEELEAYKKSQTAKKKQKASKSTSKANAAEGDNSTAAVEPPSQTAEAALSENANTGSTAIADADNQSVRNDTSDTSETVETTRLDTSS